MENEKKTNGYDSRIDTLEHIANIQLVFNLLIIPELKKRIKEHDRSKLLSPEKETYDKYIPILRTAKYGTKEYQEIRDNMQKEGLQHHYDVNRHHPEHFKNMMNDMNLIDFIEMVCDHFAASLKSDTSFMDGLDSNAKKYDYPDMIKNIFKNTYNDIFKDFESLKKGNIDPNYIRDLKLSIYEYENDGIISIDERNYLLSNIHKLEISAKK